MSTNYSDGGLSANRGVFGEITALQKAGKRAALASMAKLAGSVPCVGQSRLLVREDGSIRGTVGGGLLEAQVMLHAERAIKRNESILLEFELTQDDAANAGMICGGACTVLIEPIQPGRDEEVFAVAGSAEADGNSVSLVTLNPGEGNYQKLALLPNGELVGSTGNAETDASLRDTAMRFANGGEPRLVTAPLRVCIQPVCSTPDLFIFGAGHVAVPVAHLAHLAGFRVTVVDDRAEFADTTRFPLADRVLAVSVSEAFGSLPIDSGAFVAAVTRGHALDEEVVAQALRTAAKYIGMIGSTRKVAAVCNRLRERGFNEADLARIHAPIGIDIGAETVEEIAISIVAEIVAVRRGRGAFRGAPSR